MKRILVAIDFSPRSDRALRRATLLARQCPAELLLLHVVDDDRSPRLVEAERRAAVELLRGLVETLREVDGVTADQEVAVGAPFQSLVEAAGRQDVDLLVLGPHRRQLLRDVFVGTTVERAIRLSRRPVVMVNGLPAGPYRRLLVATDLSQGSGQAAVAAQALGLATGAELELLHVFDSPVQDLAWRAGVSDADLRGPLAEQARRAESELADFAGRVGLEAASRTALRLDSTPARSILDHAREQGADLLVVGTAGKGAVSKLLLGSVAEAVLRDAPLDVLVVPPPAEAA